ncbi:MAG: YodL domain-containing protein, partial [Clostridia bacterium]
PKVTLDDLFMKHNRDNRPFGRDMRSMSVSDVLVINQGGKRRAYYVDSIGFQEVQQFLPKARTTPKKERGEAR